MCNTVPTFSTRIMAVRIDRPGMSIGGFQHPHWDVQKSGTSDKRQEDSQDDLPPRGAEGTQSETSYEWWTTGEGLAYQERQRVRVQCSECSK